MASAVFPASDKRKFMLMLTAYFDETGSEDDPNIKILGMAGCLAPAEKWEQFETDWLKVLDNYGVKNPFHISDFAHSQKQFAEMWKDNKDERGVFYEELWNVIEELNPYIIGTFIPLERYVKVLSVEQRKTLVGAYEQTYMRCMAEIFQITLHFLKTQTEPVKVEMIYEYKSGIQNTAIEMYEEVMKMANGAFDGIISPPIFKPKDGENGLTPLQSADIIAYECNKEFKRRIHTPEFNARLGFNRLQRIINNHFGGDEVPLGEVGTPIVCYPNTYIDELFDITEKAVIEWKNEENKH